MRIKTRSLFGYLVLLALAGTIGSDLALAGDPVPPPPSGQSEARDAKSLRPQKRPPGLTAETREGGEREPERRLDSDYTDYAPSPSSGSDD